MSEREALEAARARLLAALAGLAEHAAATAAGRCPYRATRDRCTFPARCRNQRPAVPLGYRCSGARLDPTPAATAT